MKEKKRLRKTGDEALPGSSGTRQHSLRNAFKALWKWKYLVLACFLVVFLVLCGVHYFRSTGTASTILSLDYEEASKGLTPNQTRFNIFEIRSGEVMERLIEYAGLQGTITPGELSECVSVQATHDKSVNGDVNYISTSFVVSFTNNGAVAGRSAEEMLTLLC